jgi:MFS family permease
LGAVSRLQNGERMQLLRENDDYRRLWLAQTISQLGSQISYLALPLTAAVWLEATPTDMGLLVAMGSLPSLVVGIFAGALIDRRPRRPFLISSDLARAFLLALIPVAWLAGALNMPMLYVISFLSGACALFFDVAYQAFLPSVVARSELVGGNSGLELSRSAAEVAGPSIAGGLIHLLKAPMALAVDAASFLASAALIARIDVPELPFKSGAAGRSLMADALEGVREVARTPTVRSLAVAAAAIGLFNAMVESVATLYLIRVVGMEPGLLGAVFSAGGIGFVIGATLPERFINRYGIGPTMAFAIAVVGISDLALPLAGSDVMRVAAAVGIGQFFFGLGFTVYRVAQISVRQALVPEPLLGRVGATLNVLGWSTVPVGALIGGLLGQGIGLQPTLVAAALLEASIALWIWRSPLWRIPALDMLAASPAIGDAQAGTS